METANLKSAADIKREVLAQGFLDEKLFREKCFTNENETILNKSLELIFKEIEFNKTKAEGEFMNRIFHNLIDAKSNLYDSLERQIEEAEFQYSKAITDHYDIFHEIIEEIKLKGKQLHQDFVNEWSAMHDQFRKERSDIKEKQIIERKKLQDMIQSKVKEFETHKNESAIQNESIKHEIKDKGKNELNLYKIAMKMEEDKFWHAFCECFKTYKLSTFERRQEYEKLLAKDKENKKNIEIENQKVSALIENIKKIKQKTLNSAKKTQEKINFLLQKKNKIQREEVKIANDQRKCLQMEKKSITLLATNTDEIVKYLESLIEKVERILKIRETYGKLELLEEKIHPFTKCHLSEEEKLVKQENIFEVPTFSNIEDTKEYHSYQKFWQLYNKVIFDCEILEKELNSLNIKNQQLRFELKKHFSEIQVDKSILQEAAVTDISIFTDKRNTSNENDAEKYFRK